MSPRCRLILAWAIFLAIHTTFPLLGAWLAYSR